MPHKIGQYPLKGIILVPVRFVMKLSPQTLEPKQDAQRKSIEY